MATREPKYSKKNSARKTVLVNGGTSPLVYTDDGRVLGAGERIEVDALDATAKVAVDNGFLTVLDSGDQDQEQGSGASDQD